MNRDCELVHDWIDAAVSGQLDASRRERLDAHTARCAECAAKLDDALFTRRLFAAVRAPRCPDHVVDSILAATEVSRPRMAVAPRGRWLARSASWSWMGAAAAAVAVLALLLPVHTTQAPAPAPTPTVTEVAEAAQQLQMAFSVMSREMSRATSILGQEIGTHMSQSIRSGMNRAGRAFLPPAAEDGRQGSLGFPPERVLDTNPTWKG